MMSMACSTVTLGRMLRGADSSRLLTYKHTSNDKMKTQRNYTFSSAHQLPASSSSLMMSLSASHWSSRNLVM